MSLVSIKLFSCRGGTLVLPDSGSVLLSRQDGGNLVVNPPRPVWERSELTRDELMHFGFLVASAGRAMIDTLPQLEGGCINYWEAGNWALNDHAEPKGSKKARDFRRMHLHLLGRSPASKDPSWQWGESPRFPIYAERSAYALKYERFTAAECGPIVAQTEKLLKTLYQLQPSDIDPRFSCDHCGYPTISQPPCEECRH